MSLSTVYENFKTRIITAVTVIGGLIALVLFFKNKADKSEAKAILGLTAGQDSILKENQDKVTSEIKEVQKQDDNKLTPEERATRWGK